MSNDKIENTNSHGSINTIGQKGDNKTNNAKRQTRPGKKIPRWLWVIASIVIPIIAILVGIFFNNKPMSDDQINNINSPGSINTIGQTGDNTVVNNNLDIPEPKIKIDAISKNVPDGGQFKSEFKLTIDTKVPVNDMYLRANASSILEMDVQPQRTGMIPFGHTGKRLAEGYVFTTLQTAYGDYKIVVKTSQAEEVNFGYQL